MTGRHTHTTAADSVTGSPITPLLADLGQPSFYDDVLPAQHQVPEAPVYYLVGSTLVWTRTIDGNLRVFSRDPATGAETDARHHWLALRSHTTIRLTKAEADAILRRR